MTPNTKKKAPRRTRSKKRQYRVSEEWREFTLPFLRRLPKTDLHVHMDGSLRMRTLWNLSRERGIRIARSIEDLRRKVMVGPRVKNLEDYLEVFDITLKVMQDEEALTRVAYELAADAARENVRYMEIRYSPLLHLEQGLTMADTVDAVLRGLKAAEAKYDIRTGVILCGIRSMTPRRSLELAETAVAFKDDGVVAFDLAGQEKDYPAKKHREAFYRVLNANQNVTVHAGEAFGARSIHQAIHYCGAHRIGHGTRLLEDESLLRYVTDHRLPLEICLTSNVQTHAVEAVENHPFRYYLDRDVRVTLNTDSRLVSNTSVTKELYTACRAFQLNHYEVRQIVLNGFRSAFLGHRKKVTLIREVLKEMDTILGEIFPMDDVVIIQDWRALRQPKGR